MSQQRNPRYWASQWYTTRFAEEPWPAGWYWHDAYYTWNGPYNSEEEARLSMQSQIVGRLGTGNVRHPVVIDNIG